MPLRTPTMVATVTVALALTLTGCVPEPVVDPSASPSASSVTPAQTGTAATPTATSTTGPAPTATPTATAGATPTPTPTASSPSGGSRSAVLPDCDELLPLSTVHALFGDAAEPMDVGGSAADHMPGPLAASTVRSAKQAEVCTWVIPFSDGGFNVVTAELTRSARDRLIGALRTAAGYTERRLDGQVSFTRETETEVGTSTVVYVFTGTVWITVNGTLSVSTAREFASSALDAVRAANA